MRSTRCLRSKLVTAVVAFTTLAVGQFAFAATSALRILPLGDSITQGESGSNPVPGGYRWPLYQQLTNLGYTVKYTGTVTNNPADGQTELLHEGHPGWFIDGIDSIVEEVFANTPAPDVVLLLIGVNDFTHSVSTSTAVNRLDALIERIVTRRPFCQLIVANLIPIRGDSMEALIQEKYNVFLPGLVAKHAALGRRVYFTDMHSAVPLSTGISDGVHPNTLGYKMMATNWFEAIKRVIPLETPDASTTNAPAVWRVTAQPSLNQVVISFTKPVADSACNLANYLPGTGFSVAGAVLDSGTNYEVILTTTPLIPNTSYTLTLNNIQDRTANHNPMASNTVISFQTPGVSWLQDANGNWSSATSWNPASVPNGPGALARLTNAITAARTVTVDTDIALGELMIGSASAFTLNGAAGKSLTFDNGGAGALLVKEGTGADVINAPLVLNDSLTITPGTITLAGGISGPGALLKTGSDQLTLSAANSYRGGTDISAGTLLIKNSSALGTGPVSISAGGSSMLSLSGSLSLANDITLAGIGNNNVANGAITLATGATGLNTLAGSLTLSGDAKIGSSNGKMNFKVNGQINLGSWTLRIAPNNTLGNTVKGTISGLITGTGGLTWGCTGDPASTLTLTAANTFRGETKMDRVGTLVLSNALALQFSTLNFTNGAVCFGANSKSYQFGGLKGTRDLVLTNLSAQPVVLTVSNAADMTYSGVLSDNSQGGSLVKMGAGTLALSGTNTYLGSTTVSNGTLRLMQSQCLSSSNTVCLSSGGTMELAFTGTNTVFALYVDGQVKLAGVYGSSELPGRLNGTGYLRTLWPASGYQAWAAPITNGLTGYDQCATGNGYPNLLKYATGSSPVQNDGLARTDGALSGGQFAFLFHRNTNASEVSLIVEAAETVNGAAPWVGIATNTAGSWGGAANVTETGSGSPVLVTVRDSSLLGTNRFFRLRVIAP